ncbi:MAG: hypothetical protein GY806_11880 [Gammaproteobacteria bacterium]|nr:hypothetical protein [Gammaproteobacteria bacterium]
MKIRILVLYLLTAFTLALAESKLEDTDDNDSQMPETSEQESTDSIDEDDEDDEGDDRGFDPCLLNPSLSICQKS